MKNSKNKWSLLFLNGIYSIFIMAGTLSGQGFTITPSEELITTEFGASDTLMINLTSLPTSDVRIPVSVSDTTEGSVSVSEVIFTSSNWETVQKIVLKGENDDEQDGDVIYTLILSDAVSEDGSYNGLDPADVSSINYDDDRVAVEVFPTEGIIVSERGDDAVISVRLDSKPTADVFVGLTSSDPAEGAISPPSLTFNPENWSDYQFVTVEGVSDGIADSDEIFTVIFFQVASEDQDYSGFDPPDVTVTNMNLDPPGINIYPTSGLTTSEIGDRAKFSAVLLSAPNSNVTIGLSVSDSTEGELLSSLLTFTPENWNTPQNVTVVGKDDFDDDGDKSFSVTTIAAASDDPLYSGLDPADVSVTNVDEDGLGFTFYPIDTLSTSEDGKSAQFTFLLTSEPSSHVIVPVVSTDASEGTVSPGWAMFKKDNWSKPKKVTVTGMDDDIADNDIRYAIIVGPAESSDTNYEGLDPVDFFVTNRDNDSAYVLISPTSGLVTTETGQQDTFSLTLAARPRKDVIIPLSSSDNSEGNIKPDSVLIPVNNWSDSFEAVITGKNDDDVDGDQTFTILTAPVVSLDYIFSGIDPPDIEVINLDREPVLNLSLAALDFNSVQIDTSAVISLSVSNAGNDTLKITEITSKTTNFSVLPEEATVPAGDSVFIAVTFSPDTIDTYTDTLTIMSNSSQRNIKIALQGLGVTIDNVKPVLSEVTHRPENPGIGTDLAISCTATDENGMLDVQIFYRQGGNGVEKQLAMISSSSDTDTYQTSIPAEDVTLNGLSYSIVGMDNRYNSTTTGPYSVNISFSSEQLTSSMNGSALAGGIPLETWRMFSIPATLDEDNSSKVLNDELGKRDVTTWELWTWNENKWKYPSSLEAGKGYWLIQWMGPSISIDPGSGTTVDQTSFAFTLQPGWNMIGNPYPFETSLSLDQADYYGPITYGLVGEGWKNVNNSLLPWGGYVVYNKGSAPETITLNPIKTFQTLTRKNVTVADGWKLNIGAYGKTYVDPGNAVGRLSGSLDELDFRDNPEPPYMGGYVSVVMPRDDWSEDISNFTSDIRSLAEPDGVWDVELRVKKETSPVTLSLEMEGDFPVEHDIVLLDLINKETHHIKELSSVTLNQNWEKLPVYPFKVIAGSPEYVSSMTQEILSQLPETFTLYQNYPNPFNPTTTIRFEVPTPSQVTLRIYNLMGQEVRTLTRDWFPIGSHQLMWNGKDQRGIPVSAGVYIYRLLSQDFQKTRKMVLLK
tara:strand:+ start:32613 stop:36320 length:3708 start_codon:yes stop_codon:yes gene_type:complete